MQYIGNKFRALGAKVFSHVLMFIIIYSILSQNCIRVQVFSVNTFDEGMLMKL